MFVWGQFARLSSVCESEKGEAKEEESSLFFKRREEEMIIIIEKDGEICWPA